MKIGQVGNLIIMGATSITCPVCGEIIPAFEVHRHDGPLDIDAEWHDRMVEFWVIPGGSDAK